MCVVWLGYKMGDWFVLCFFEFFVVERICFLWDVEVFIVYIKFGVSLGLGVRVVYY